MTPFKQRESAVVMAPHLQAESNEDDGSVFTEKNGVKRHFRHGERVYRCSNAEAFVVNCAKYGRNSTVQTLWLKLRQPITMEDISAALWIVSRQVPHLQFCLLKKKDGFWFKRMKELEIDFEFTNKGALEMHDELVETVFDLWKGPLWKVRLNIQNPENNNQANGRDYSGYLALCVHHSITDATANMKICREIVNILNRQSEGQTVQPILSPLAPTMDELASESKSSRAYYAKNVSNKIYSTIVKNFNKESSFNGALPIPQTKQVKAKTIFNDFTKMETDAIIALCKRANITVNSFMVTVSNFTLMAVAQSRSSTPLGSKKITTIQAVNMRRYFDKQYNDASGCHVSYLEDNFEMSLKDIDQFWSVAKKIHLDIKNRIEVCKEPIKNIPLIPFSFKIVPINHFLTSNGCKNRTICHFFLSNMGNLQNMLPEPKEKDNVEINYVLRSVAGPYCGCPFLVAFHTFRERLCVSFDYHTNTIADETAHDFVNLLFEHIRNLIKCKSWS